MQGLPGTKRLADAGQVGQSACFSVQTQTQPVVPKISQMGALDSATADIMQCQLIDIVLGQAGVRTGQWDYGVLAYVVADFSSIERRRLENWWAERGV